MAKEIVELQRKKKQSLISRLLGLKERVQEEKDRAEHKEEIQKLESEIKVVDQEISVAEIEAAKELIKPLEQEATRLRNEWKSLQDRAAWIAERLVDLHYEAEALIPRRRVQTSSAKTVKMVRGIPEITAFTIIEDPSVISQGSGLVYKDGLPVGEIPVGHLGRKVRKPIETKMRFEEKEIECVPSKIAFARHEGYWLKPGETIPEPEELTSKNSTERLAFQLPESLQ